MDSAKTRPKVRFIISDVEMAMAQQLTQFGGVLMLLLRERQNAPADAPPVPLPIPEMPEVFGRALAFITNTDPEQLGEAFSNADVQIVNVPHGSPIPEQRLMEGDDFPVVLLDPRGRPMARS